MCIKGGVKRGTRKWDLRKLGQTKYKGLWEKKTGGEKGKIQERVILMQIFRRFLE